MSKTSAGDPVSGDVLSVDLAGTITNFTTPAGVRAVFQTGASNLPGTPGGQSYVP